MPVAFHFPLRFDIHYYCNNITMEGIAQVTNGTAMWKKLKKVRKMFNFQIPHNIDQAYSMLGCPLQL